MALLQNNRINGASSSGNGHEEWPPSLPGQRLPQRDAGAMNSASMHDLPSHRPASPSDAFLGREIRELRRRRGWTQKNLADMIGVTGAQMHRYETGSTRMATHRLAALAEALGVRAETLISSYRGDAVPVPTPPTNTDSGNDLLALVELFARISNPKNRNVVLAVARILAAPVVAGSETE